MAGRSLSARGRCMDPASVARRFRMAYGLRECDVLGRLEPEHPREVVAVGGSAHDGAHFFSVVTFRATERDGGRGEGKRSSQ